MVISITVTVNLNHTDGSELIPNQLLLLEFLRGGGLGTKLPLVTG